MQESEAIIGLEIEGCPGSFRCGPGDAFPVGTRWQLPNACYLKVESPEHGPHWVYDPEASAAAGVGGASYDPGPAEEDIPMTVEEPPRPIAEELPPAKEPPPPAHRKRARRGRE